MPASMMGALSRPAQVAAPERERTVGQEVFRWLKRWAMMAPWILLPLLPAIGIGVSSWLGVGL